MLDVGVATFTDRTRLLRRRLADAKRKLQAMEDLKRECDEEAHTGAERMALGGFTMLVVYWAGMAYLTFWDHEWDVVEPITYLFSLSTVMWFSLVPTTSPRGLLFFCHRSIYLLEA
ncbi:hypothetical protein BDZ94DRAFT_1314862 [Collybia nuda]|uniref:Calcium uniporter protein, mitochondrial n=1 Tax=Collybia nuda TaxID=64659 RepID=A0A9P5XS65_9AGAR|nr:hypothetical protein BDZ94DRAFT_1314862 [Collybia nuda]